MGAAEEATQNLVNNKDVGVEYLVNIKVNGDAKTNGDVENLVNVKISSAENPVVNDIEYPEETSTKDREDCILGEVKEMLKSLASKWEIVVDANALQVIPLKRAMTNLVFQIKWQTTNGESSRKVLIRIYGEGTDIFFDGDVEVTTFEFMSKNGQGPHLLGRFPNGRIEEFINAQLIEAKHLCSPEKVEALHLDTMDKEISTLENELSGTHQRIGFCHNDFQYGSTMLDEKSSSVNIIVSLSICMLLS
ncbi:choline kinase 2 [Spatholobus suberectus]|nr:choline kinase 2 [Spatholobus suberectus]